MNKLRLAKLRQEVYVLRGRRAALERVAMSFVPMVAACLLERRRRPGGPPVYYLSVATRWKAKHRYVRQADLDYFRRRAGHYKEYSEAMAEWVRVNHEIGRRLRALGKGRCEPLAIRHRGKTYWTKSS